MSMQKFIPATGTMRGLGTAGKVQDDERLNIKTPKIKMPKPRASAHRRYKRYKKPEAKNNEWSTGKTIFFIMMGVVMNVIFHGCIIN